MRCSTARCRNSAKNIRQEMNMNANDPIVEKSDAGEPIRDPPDMAPAAPRAQIMHRQDAASPKGGQTQPVERIIVRHSEEIDQLIGALAEASCAFGEVGRTVEATIESRRTGGKFTYEYETLADVIGATRVPLGKHGLAVLQFPFPGASSITIRTMLAHKSGQWIYNDLSATLEGVDPQSVGKGITYLSRYARKAILGISAGYDDDDGASASGPKKPPADAPEGYRGWLDDLTACADEGVERLQAAWTGSKLAYRKHLTTTAQQTWAAVKQRAAGGVGAAAAKKTETR